MTILPLPTRTRSTPLYPSYVAAFERFRTTNSSPAPTASWHEGQQGEEEEEEEEEGEKGLREEEGRRRTSSALPQRRLRIDQYSRAQTGVWYYHVDIELRDSGVEPPPDVDRFSDADDVLYYSVRRRYSEFLELYEAIRERIRDYTSAESVRTIPPFPQKEYFSPSVLGLLWRVSTSQSVLEERRGKFEALLQWIEGHPWLRQLPVYVAFLGRPPQASVGYVSLKQYSSQHWLASLEQLNKDKEKRRRRLSSDHTHPPSSSASTKKRRQTTDAASPCSDLREAAAKRQRRRHTTENVTTIVARVPPPATRSSKKRRRAHDDPAQLGEEHVVPLLLTDGSRGPLLALPAVEPVAQVEGNTMHRKKQRTSA